MAYEPPLLDTSLIAPVDTLVERIEPTRIEPFVEGVPSLDEMPTVAEISGATTEFTGDRCPQQIHQFQVDLLALKRNVVLVRGAILQQNEELEGMRAVCVVSTTKLTHVGEQLDSLLVQLEFTLECESNPIRAYIDGVGSTVRLPWPIGQRETELPSEIVCIDQVAR